jgi:hypothetical protein
MQAGDEIGYRHPLRQQKETGKSSSLLLESKQQKSDLRRRDDLVDERPNVTIPNVDIFISSTANGY